MTWVAEPARPSTATPYGIVIAGVGGTGIVTVAQVLGTAAMLDGFHLGSQREPGEYVFLEVEIK